MKKLLFVIALVIVTASCTPMEPQIGACPSLAGTGLSGQCKSLSYKTTAVVGRGVQVSLTRAGYPVVVVTMPTGTILEDNPTLTNVGMGITPDGFSIVLVEGQTSGFATVKVKSCPGECPIQFSITHYGPNP